MRHLVTGCAFAAGALLIAACSSSGVNPAAGTMPAQALHAPGLAFSPAATNVLKNPCFATGKLSPWTAWIGSGGTSRGTAVISTAEVYGCKYSAYAGTDSPPAVTKLHGISQKVTIPTNGELTWWYYGGSDDEIKYADDEVDLYSGTTLVYQCFKKLITTKKWTEGKCSLGKYAGKAYDLVLGVNDNGYSKTYIYWYVDDLSLSGS
jgi:hypothetical protein